MSRLQLQGSALLSRLLLLHLLARTRPVAMSVSRRSEGNPVPPKGPDTSRDPGTAEMMAVHRLHRDACEARKRTYVDPSSGYKVFTEYAHLQRGKCCGSACRHCPYGQVNVKDPAMKKQFNSLFYV